jgi:N-formylglutamate amidohydrolase
MNNKHTIDDFVKHNSPIVLHVPHASRKIPSDIRCSIKLSDSELEIELNKMTDSYTDILFIPDSTNAQTVVFPISRLVMDPERFLDDNQEIMAKHGMGVIYTRTADGRKLRDQPTVRERERLINRYYRPHHKKLEDCVFDCFQKFGRCIIIDCHSFPSIPLPYELDQSDNRPDICIGVDDFHSPNWLVNRIRNEFEKFGYSTAINKPFSGTIVPMRYYRKNKAVLSVMIEVNRRLYMDESSGEKISAFNTIKRHLSMMVNKIHALSIRYGS